jgi:hypothetical protein
MSRQGIKYKTTIADPGSDLHEALSNNDMKKAEAIYQECERAERELLARSRPKPPKEVKDAGIT